MHRGVISGLLFGVVPALACTIPDETLPNTITDPFRIQVQNASQPAIHNLYMNLLQAGAGDQHLFIGSVGTPTFDLTLVDGAITHGGIHAVINGEFSEIDNTTKMFMTERGDPKAIFAPTYACNPDTDELQVELRFVGRQTSPDGGWNCVRPTFNESYEFRYYPPDNMLVDPNRTCLKVTLVVIPQDGTPTTSTIPSSTSTVSTGISSTTLVTSVTSTPTSSPLPYTDLTAVGFRFIGCAPEQKTVSPPDGDFRTLPVLYASDVLTNELCASYCLSNGYAYAGTEFARECWCGSSYAATRQPGTTLASLAGCSSSCAGDAGQNCGGADWLSLYAACPGGEPCVNAEFI